MGPLNSKDLWISHKHNEINRQNNNNNNNKNYNRVLHKTVNFLKQRNGYALMGGRPVVYYLTQNETLIPLIKKKLQKIYPEMNNKNLNNIFSSTNYNIYIKKNNKNRFITNLKKSLGNDSKYLLETNQVFYGSSAETVNNESVFQIFFKDNKSNKKENLINLHLLPKNNPKTLWLNNVTIGNDGLKYLSFKNITNNQISAIIRQTKNMENRQARFNRFFKKKQNEYELKKRIAKRNSLPEPINPTLKYRSPNKSPYWLQKLPKRLARRDALRIINGKVI